MIGKSSHFLVTSLRRTSVTKRNNRTFEAPPTNWIVTWNNLTPGILVRPEEKMCELPSVYLVGYVALFCFYNHQNWQKISKKSRKFKRASSFAQRNAIFEFIWSKRCYTMQFNMLHQMIALFCYIILYCITSYHVWYFTYICNIFVDVCCNILY